MHHRLISGVFLLALAWLGCQADSATAQPPQYLVLEAPAVTAPDSRHPGPGYYPGVGRDVSTQAYAYGWYGVTPRKRWSRQFGYYRNYTQWSRR